MFVRTWTKKNLRIGDIDWEMLLMNDLPPGSAPMPELVSQIFEQISPATSLNGGVWLGQRPGLAKGRPKETGFLWWWS